jgi:putative FmdB family regulatory protein
MPIYEYRCPACAHRFEVLQRMGEGADGLVCPSCGAQQVEKQFSTFAANAGAGSSPAAADGGCGAPGCGTGFT